MLGQAGLAWARARAGARPLAALAVIAAVATLLLGSLVGAVGAFENRGVMTAIDGASEDRGYLVVTFHTGPEAEHIPGIRRALAAIGADGALEVVHTDGFRYELRPIPARMSGDVAIALESGIPKLSDELKRAGVPVRDVSGGLRSTLSPLIDGINLRRGPAAMAIGIVATLALVIVSVAAAEPVRQRLDERALLRARGLSKGRLARLNLVETVPVVAVATLLGAAAAFAVTWAWSGTYASAPLLLVITAALIVAGVIAAVVATLHGVDRRSGRGDALAGVGALVVLAVLTGLAVWQFWQAASPVITLANGSTVIDPLIAMAPALVLALFALGCVIVVRPVAALFALPAGRGRKLSPAIPLRLAARRTGRHALTAGSVAFAVATTSLAVVYLGTLANLGSLPEALRVGTDVRVISVRDDTTRATIRTLPGIDASMRARVLAARGAGTNYPVLAVEASQLGAVMSDAGGLIDPAAIQAAIEVPPFGVEVPATAPALEAEMRVPEGETLQYEDENGEQQEWIQPPGYVSLALTIVDGNGAVSQQLLSNYNKSTVESGGGSDTSFELIGDGVTRIERFALDGPGPWRLIAVEAVQENTSPGPGKVTLLARADGRHLDLSPLQGGSRVTSEGDALVLDLPWDGTPGLPRTRASSADQPSHFPAAVSAKLAASMNLKVGSTLSLEMANMPVTVDVQVATIIEVVPGLQNGEGLVIDLIGPNLGGAEPPVDNELWLSSAEPDALADAVNAAVQGVVIDVIGARSAQSAQETVVVFALAAIGAVALAIVALLLRRARGDAADGELAILAVLGVGRRKAARVRAVEDVFVIVVAVLAGVGAGLAASWLVVPSIARAAYARTGAEFEVAVTADPTLLAGVALAIGLLFALIAASVRSPASLARVLREGE